MPFRFSTRLLAATLLTVWALALGTRGVTGADPAAVPAEAEAWHLEALEARAAWKRAGGLPGTNPGSPVVVAVVDTGVDASHPDLKDRLLPGRNLIQGAPDPMAAGDDSGVGHGTHVAGILAALSGPLPIQILPVKALEADATGRPGDVAAAIRWAAEWHGPGGERVRVINLSLGDRFGTVPEALAEAVRYALEQNILLVAAAGNDGGSVQGYYPAALSGVISVGATRRDHRPDPGSNLGALVLAPGHEIFSTLPGGGYGLRSGTSFAAPAASAAAAVLWSVYPDASRAEVIDALLSGHATRRCGGGSDVCSVLSLDQVLVRFAALKPPILDRVGPYGADPDLALTGSAKAGAMVTMHVRQPGGEWSVAAEAIAGTGGRFAVTVVLPSDGVWELSASARLNGEETGRGDVRTYTLDRSPPAPALVTYGSLIGNGEYRLEWLSPTDPDVAEYWVERRLLTVPAGAAGPHPADRAPRVYRLPVRAMEFRGLSGDAVYQFSIIAVDRAGNRSEPAAVRISVPRMDHRLR